MVENLYRKEFSRLYKVSENGVSEVKKDEIRCNINYL